MTAMRKKRVFWSVWVLTVLLLGTGTALFGLSFMAGYALGVIALVAFLRIDETPLS